MYRTIVSLLIPLAGPSAWARRPRPQRETASQGAIHGCLIVKHKRDDWSADYVYDTERIRLECQTRPILDPHQPDDRKSWRGGVFNRLLLAADHDPGGAGQVGPFGCLSETSGQ
jgi:hypothetical protein